MIKAKESQGLFDYSCKQTYRIINGKFMNNENIHLDPALHCLDYCGFRDLTINIYSVSNVYQQLFFYSGIATFTLTCQAKGGNAGTQLIPEEASLKCKSNSEAENKVSCQQ